MTPDPTTDNARANATLQASAGCLASDDAPAEACAQAPLLSYDNVSIAYHGVPVTSQVSFSLQAGETLGIVGESGSGKTSLIQAALGLLKPGGTLHAGSISYEGRDLSSHSAQELQQLRGAQLGMIFQDCASTLCPTQTILEQALDERRAHQQPTDQVKEELLSWLERFNVSCPEQVAQSYPFQLSGGQCQRAGIALALIMGPRVIFADEPTSALDVHSQRQVLEELRQVQAEDGLTMMVVSHNLGVIEQLADKVLVLKDGHVVETGSTQEILTHPKDPYAQELINAVPRITKVPAQAAPAKDQADLQAPSQANVPANQKAASAQAPSQANQPLLEVTGLSKTFAQGHAKRSDGTAHYAVDQVSFSLLPGECVGLLGQSGCGKTTLARLVMRFLEPTEGSVVFDGTDLTQRTPKQMRSVYSRLQMVFQNPLASFNPRKTFERSILEPLLNQGVPKKEARRKAEALFEECELPTRLLGRIPSETSGGQCQRAALVRALMTDPKLLICDEATSALDVTVQRHIMDLLGKLRENHHMGILFICHDIALTQSLCSRVLVMDEGKLVEMGLTDQVLLHPQSECAKELINAVL